MPNRFTSLDRLQRFGPFIVTGAVLLLLWTLVLWFSAAQQRRLLADTERSLDLMNRLLVEQVAGLLGDAAADLRAIDEWIQSHPSVDPRRDAALGRLATSVAKPRGQFLQLGLELASGELIAWSPAIVAVVDRDQRYAFANSGFEQWYGTSRRSIIGRTVQEVLGQAEYERSRPWLERALAGESVVFEKAYEDTDRYSHLRIAYLPLRLDDGSIDGLIAVATDITEHRAEEARLRRVASTDLLTGTLNRAGFEHAVDRRAQRSGNGLAALLCIDLDRFKEVNDDHGHLVGDEVLKAFSKRVGKLLRPGDTFARLGGDEFVVVLDGMRDASNAQLVAEKVLGAAHAPFLVDSIQVRIGASIGIAIWRNDEDDARSLVQRADSMLYRAKQAGRGRYVMEG